MTERSSTGNASAPTPRPWAVGTQFAERCGGHTYIPIPIAVVHRDVDGYGRGEGEANARLIAALPDLVKEMERLQALVNAQTAQDMARLSASEAACYRWPEDTADHRAMREAFCDGAAHIAPAQRQPDRNAISLAAKAANLQFWRDSEAQKEDFAKWKAGEYAGECPQHIKGALVDYITDAVVEALAGPSTDRSTSESSR